MVVAAIKHMASNFAKLDKFEGWNLGDDGEKATMEQIRKRNKWDNDDYVLEDSNKPKENNVAGPSADNMVEHNNSIRKPGHLKNDCKGGKVGNKAKGSGINGSMNGSSNSLK
ncbi:hypothetical protein Tco_0064250, partial [Tanacetum coccineum]